MALQIPPNCDLTLGLVCHDKSIPGESTWILRVDERFLNPAGTMQGGFLTAALDSAMGASVVSAQRGRSLRVANAEMKTSFLRAAYVGDELTICAKVIKAGRSVSFVEATAHNHAHELVATASSTYILRDR